MLDLASIRESANQAIPLWSEAHNGPSDRCFTEPPVGSKLCGCTLSSIEKIIRIYLTWIAIEFGQQRTRMRPGDKHLSGESHREPTEKMLGIQDAIAGIGASACSCLGRNPDSRRCGPQSVGRSRSISRRRVRVRPVDDRGHDVGSEIVEPDQARKRRHPPSKPASDVADRLHPSRPRREAERPDRSGEGARR